MHVPNLSLNIDRFLPAKHASALTCSVDSDSVDHVAGLLMYFCGVALPSQGAVDVGWRLAGSEFEFGGTVEWL